MSSKIVHSAKPDQIFWARPTLALGRPELHQKPMGSTPRGSSPAGSDSWIVPGRVNSLKLVRVRGFTSLHVIVTIKKIEPKTSEFKHKNERVQAQAVPYTYVQKIVCFATQASSFNVRVYPFTSKIVKLATFVGL